MKNISQYEPSFGAEEQKAVFDYMGSGGWLTENKKTEQFEAELASFIGAARVSCVNNGTISLSLALLAAGLKVGDKVIVPDITMIATANAVKLVGMEPILIDVDASNLCLDLMQTMQAIQADMRIKAVIYVSLNGRSHQACEFLLFKHYLKDHNVALIEDAAQSFGSKDDSGAFLGTLGDIGSFSFSPHKLISTGQGGALVSKDAETYMKIERLKDFGRLAGGGDVHEYFGINSKFTDIQAVIGSEQLKKAQHRIQRKNEIYGQYQSRLQNSPLIEMINIHDNAVPWFVDVYVRGGRRDELIIHLRNLGIQTRPIYQALHTQKVFDVPGEQYDEAQFKNANNYGSSGLWLPSSFNLTREDIDRVCDAIASFKN